MILRPYQKRGIAYLIQNNGGAVFLKMRMGKTIIVIRYLKLFPNARILVLAPYSPLEGWREQLIADGVPADRVFLEYDTIKGRKEFLDKTQNAPGWFLFYNGSPLNLPFENYRWDACILDESTFIANPKSKISKWCLSMAPRFKIRIILTGTPAPESELQYFNQLSFVNKDILPYRSYWDFRAKCFYNSFFHNWKMRPGDRLKLAKALNEKAFIVEPEEAGLVNTKIYERRFVQLSPANRKKYNSALQDWIIGDRILKFAGARWDVVRRLCGGEEKRNELEYLLKGELKGRRVIVWAWHVEEVLDISQRLKCPHICGLVPKPKREEIRKEFLKNGDVLVAQPETWKFGTLLVGVDVVVFFSAPAGLMTIQQIEERTVDYSQSEIGTLIINMVASKTVDEDILKGANNKESKVETLNRIRLQCQKQ